MEINRRFMPLLTKLGGWDMDFCYKHVASRALARLFNRAKIGRHFLGDFVRLGQAKQLSARQLPP